MEKKDILKSDFSEEFVNQIEGSAFLYSRKTSSDYWDKYIDKKSSSYFSLLDNNWIVESKKNNLGFWIEDYNNDNSEQVQKLLLDKIPWKLEDTIIYCISRFLIIESTWENFTKLWMNFIECDDDCPIIINLNVKGNAIVFNPIGSISFIES